MVICPQSPAPRRSWRWLVLLALALAFPSNATADPDCAPGSPRGRYKALVCWLWRAKVELPDEQFAAEMLEIYISDMTCTNFAVEALTSSSAQSSEAVSTSSVQVDLTGMSAKCTGRYAIGSIGASGNVVANVATGIGGPSLHLRVDVASKPLGDPQPASNNSTSNETTPADDKASLPFPTTATVSACQPNFLVKDVQFTGSLSAKIIGLFSGTIAKAVTTAMNENVCSLIKRNGESTLNGGLHAARDYLGGLILDPPPGSDGVHANAGETFPELEQALFDDAPKPQDRRPGNAAVTWDKDMPFLKRTLLGINDIFEQHIHEGFILRLMEKLTTWHTREHFASKYPMTADDCEDCGFFFKGLNGLAHSLTNGGGAVEIPLPETFLNFHNNRTFVIPHYGNVTLTAHKVTVAGIDNLTDLALFRPEGQNLLLSTVDSEAGFNVSVLVDLEVRPANGAIFQGDALHETFEVHLNTSGVNLMSSSAWELDREIFSKLTVGSFIYGSYTLFEDNRNVLTCIIEALSSVAIRDLEGRMTVDAMHLSPVIPAYEAGSGTSLEGDIDKLINHVLHLLYVEYPATTTEAVAGIIQTPVRNMLNDGLANLISDTKKMPLHCVTVDLPKNKTERPFRLDSNRAVALFNEVVNDESAIAAVNAFVGCVVSNLETNQLLSGHFYNFSLGELNIVLHDLHLEHVDSVHELALLQPEIDHYHLANRLGYGACDATTDAKDCKTTSVSFGMNLVHATDGYLGNVNVQMSLKNLELEGGAEMKYDMNWLPFLQISDLLANPQCLSVPITSYDFYGLNATVESLEVTIDVSLNSQGGGPRSFAYKTDNSTELAQVVSALMGKGTVLLQEMLGDKFLMQLNAASNVCQTPVNPHRSIDTKRSTSAAGLWTFLIVLAFVAGNAWLFLRGFNNEEELLAGNDASKDNGQAEGEQESSLREPLLDKRDEMDEKLEVETPRKKFPLASSSSLMYHPSIHPFVKFGFPAVLALAFVLFFSSNLSIGASVDLLVTRANGSNLTNLVNIYEFSLGSTMREMANAGVYLLMLLILFCSGIWPYVKLVLLTVSWMASARRLPPVKREKILYLLDSLGKFSLIDMFVLILMMVAFRYNLEVEGVGSLDVYVTPKYGFYSFLFATIVSLVSGHFMLYLHRRTMLPSVPVYSGRYESLSRHIFDDKHNRGLVKLTKRFRRTILFTMFLSLVLICVGCGLKSFHFKFNGVAGAALGDDKARSFSLVSIGEHIPHSVRDSSSFGIYWIQTCYFFFALVMPLVCLLSLFVLFLVPLRLKQQQKVFVIAEISNAWSAIEVFVIAIVASLIEISPFSETMVGEHCGLLNQILAGWSGGEGDDLDLKYCFDVKSSLDGSSAVLIIGVVLNSLVVSSLHRFAHHAIWERVEREDWPAASEDENKIVRDCVRDHTFVSRLRKRPRMGAFMFEDVSFGPDSEYQIDFENVAENEEPHTSNSFWADWSKIVSVI